jgi:hypothetical protein
MDKNIKLVGSDKTIENVTVVRKSLDDEEAIYCSVFGYYPSYKCEFSVTFDDKRKRMKALCDMYEKFMGDGFHTFVANYSNSTFNGDFVDEEDDVYNDISKEIHMMNFVVYNDRCLVSFCNGWPGIDVMTHTGPDVITDIVDKYLSECVTQDNRVRCNIIAHGAHDFYLEEFEIKINDDLDLGLYNEGFGKVNEEIVRSIKEDKNGLYILHGEAGTGKTTYIRHLIKQLKRSKRFIYVPSNLVSDITSPNFISFIMDNKNSVFVIEDCENLVVTRNETRSSAVADMLNMTDGILADALEIKFICTFNTPEKNIDEALLRPGRCRMKYDFGKLEKSRAVEAARRLGLEEPDKDITLAEMFSGKNGFIKEKKKIGF